MARKALRSAVSSLPFTAAGSAIGVEAKGLKLVTSNSRGWTEETRSSPEGSATKTQIVCLGFPSLTSSGCTPLASSVCRIEHNTTDWQRVRIAAAHKPSKSFNLNTHLGVPVPWHEKISRCLDFKRPAKTFPELVWKVVHWKLTIFTDLQIDLVYRASINSSEKKELNEVASSPSNWVIIYDDRSGDVSLCNQTSFGQKTKKH